MLILVCYRIQFGKTPFFGDTYAKVQKLDATNLEKVRTDLRTTLIADYRKWEQGMKGENPKDPASTTGANAIAAGNLAAGAKELGKEPLPNKAIGQIQFTSIVPIEDGPLPKKSGYSAPSITKEQTNIQQQKKPAPKPVPKQRKSSGPSI